LIERCQGAGTIVADSSTPTFASPTGDFESILQYARDATFVLMDSVEADRTTLTDLGLSGSYLKPGEPGVNAASTSHRRGNLLP
jgi:GntR family transcriptional regulator